MDLIGGDGGVGEFSFEGFGRTGWEKKEGTNGEAR